MVLLVFKRGKTLHIVDMYKETRMRNKAPKTIYAEIEQIKIHCSLNQIVNLQKKNKNT